MDAITIREMSQGFEDYMHVSEEGVEYWYARDLQVVLGYAKWQKFQNVIERAVESCEAVGFKPENHFTQVGKMVEVGSGGQREISSGSKRLAGGEKQEQKEAQGV